MKQIENILKEHENYKNYDPNQPFKLSSVYLFKQIYNLY